MSEKMKELWDNPSDDYDQKYGEIRRRIESKKYSLEEIFDTFMFAIVDRTITYPFSPLVQAFEDVIDEKIHWFNKIEEKARTLFDEEGNCTHIYQCKEMKEGKPTGNILCTLCSQLLDKSEMNPKEKIKFLNKKIEEIGPISKRSYFEEDDLT